MKKHILAIAITIIIVLIASVIYFAPKFMLDKEMQKVAKVKANNAIFTARVIEEYSKNTKIKASELAKKIVDEMNKTTINPYDRKNNAYTYENNCKSCNSVNFDDTTQTIILTSYNKNGELIARSVIKPPSFVVYSKFD